MSQELPVIAPQVGLAQLNERSREIFRQIVESYLATGEPVGSRNLSRIIPMTLSPASVRNVMSDLEQLGLDLRAAHLGRPAADRARPALLRRRSDGDRRPHRGRTPRDRGAGRRRRRREIDGSVLNEASGMLSGLTRARRRRACREVEAPAQAHRFRAARAGAALVVLVAEDGQVENRIIDLPAGLPPSALTEATNFLNARIRGRTLDEASAEIERALTPARPSSTS